MNKEGLKISKKDLILEAAKKVFAENGYDSSRVDEIAERAGVKKSLIYYHFEGKDHLLQEILNNFFKEYDLLLRTEENDTSGNDKYIGFLERNSDILRVILIESLKKNTKMNSIFKAVNILMDYEKEHSDYSSSLTKSVEHKRWVNEFFMSILPMLGYVCYKEAWCNFYNVNTKTLDNDFIEAYSETHKEYHKRIGL